MSVIFYNKIEMSGQKIGICCLCNKRAKRSKTVHQTLNPYNKNKDGGMKSASDIRIELCRELKEWKKELLFHVKCEE